MTHSRGIHLYTSPVIGNILNSLVFLLKNPSNLYTPPPKYYNKQDIKCHSIHSREKVLSDPTLEGKLLFGKTVENCVGKAKKSPKQCSMRGPWHLKEMKVGTDVFFCK